MLVAIISTFLLTLCQQTIGRFITIKLWDTQTGAEQFGSGGLVT
jgi:hypothetical protein